jgi:hypothetical protein
VRISLSLGIQMSVTSVDHATFIPTADEITKFTADLVDEKKHLIYFVDSTDTKYQFAMVDQVFSRMDYELFVPRMFSSLPNDKCLPLHVRTLTLLAPHVKCLNSKQYQYLAGFTAQLVEYPSFDALERSHAKDLLNLLFQTKNVLTGCKFIQWMATEHMGELRFYDKALKSACLWKPYDVRVFRIVRYALCRHSQAAFEDFYMTYLGRGVIEITEFALPIQNPDILARMRRFIRKIFDILHPLDPLEPLGCLVACYGEQQDIERCLKLNRPDFTIGLALNNLSPAIEKTPEVETAIAERAKEYLSGPKTVEYPKRKDSEDCFFCSL